MGRLVYPERVERPVTRADCSGVPRPCPFVGCRHHLYLDVSTKRASIKFNFPGMEPWDMKYSCVLDFTDTMQGSGMTLEAIGAAINVTRERVRQIEEVAVKRANAELRRLLGDKELSILRR